MSIATKSLIYICTIIAILIPWCTVINKPTSEINHLIQYVTSELKVVIPITLRFNNEKFIFPDLKQAAQIQINEELHSLGARRLELVLVDSLPGKNVSQEYLMDLILHHENSLGISSDSLQAAIFYTLESIHSNDLPFFVAQTVLYHFLNAEVDVFSRSANEDFIDDLEFEIGFGQGTNKTRNKEILKTIEELASAMTLITRLRWTTNTELVSESNRVEISFPGRFSKTLKSDSNTANRIRTILEDELRLSQRPRNNFQIRLLAAYKKKTLSNIERLLSKLDKTSGKDKFLPQLAQVIADVGKSQNVSWLGYLEKTQKMLDEIESFQVKPL
ncbi:hypothetical protein CANMA_001055 [Candida margitis]|uniref:uncharacterized protein n=1 Tax=Candida margitis TaxID=1775924 RepID=UPI002226C7E1|nr:uncharacterized protein CANMA_001055 [Candida margitis]KAI5969913.1 hypothetical protein CANMA_001055 [Candida margitis]